VTSVFRGGSRFIYHCEFLPENMASHLKKDGVFDLMCEN
jgi:hypothetical protein